MFQVATWFQPSTNFSKLKSMLGSNVVWGVEIGNPPITDQKKWTNDAAAHGLLVALKKPVAPVPANTIAYVMTVDEPNGKGVLPSALKANSDELHAMSPKLPVYLSLAGDKITSANFDKPAEKQLYLDYLSLLYLQGDMVWINVYSMNRNDKRYKVSWTADCVKKLRSISNIKIGVWVECNDQRRNLPPVADGGTNRAPTPAEIKETVALAIAAGASAVGFFTTCDARENGSYGWPENYLPMIDRNGASMSAQYEMCKSISAELNPVQPPVDEIALLKARVAELERWRKS